MTHTILVLNVGGFYQNESEVLKGNSGIFQLGSYSTFPLQELSITFKILPVCFACFPLGFIDQSVFIRQEVQGIVGQNSSILEFLAYCI